MDGRIGDQTGDAIKVGGNAARSGPSRQNAVDRHFGAVRKVALELEPRGAKAGAAMQMNHPAQVPGALAVAE